MGNKTGQRNDPFNQMVHDLRKQNNRRVSINPEKKYRALLIEKVDSCKLPSTLKQAILYTLQQKITQVELIQTVTCINVLKNNQFDPSSNRVILRKDKPESQFVIVNFGKNFLKKILGKERSQIILSIQQKSQKSQTQSIDSQPIRREKRQKLPQNKQVMLQAQKKQKLKILGFVMKKQLNRINHPFGRLNKTFAEFIESNSNQFAPEGCKQQLYENNVQKLVNEWCEYLQNSCLLPYKKWAISYTGLQQNKYNGWIKNILLQQIWNVNNGYLFSMLTTVIHRRKTQLKINWTAVQRCATALTPSVFGIDPKLQIEGHFFDSIYEMAEIVGKVCPQQILSQLETVKKRICTDIDNYHRLVQKGEVYEIDSDNISGIVGYILCKIASRIDQIHTHLIFLRVLFGEKAYYYMGLGSYMLSTIFMAIEFLQSEHFNQILAESLPFGASIVSEKTQQYSDTKVGVSQGQMSQASVRDIHTNSLLSNI